MKKILVIEDDKGSASFLSIVLKREGYDVTTVQDGQSGLNIINSFAPDLIVLDMYLPVMSGWDFLEQYQQQATALAPIIALSAGNVDPETIPGVARFVHKPFTISDLVAVIRELLPS